MNHDHCHLCGTQLATLWLAIGAIVLINEKFNALWAPSHAARVRTSVWNSGRYATETPIVQTDRTRVHAVSNLWATLSAAASANRRPLQPLEPLDTKTLA